jgi:hypothetical protein
MKPKRLAIAISGAVSLGSYEAGVLYEVVRAIGEHNQHPDTMVNPQQRIEIDVLTGASAGAMTAAIGAQKLLYEKDALSDPQTNAFYLPWIKDVDLIPLLHMRDGDDQRCSMLSSAFVETISRRYITRRYANGAVPPAQRHPAAARAIRLGIALSNLNGVDYGQPQSNGGKFSYTRFQDDYRRLLDSTNETDDSEAIWEQVRCVAISSGAFPFAFRVQEVCRETSEFENGAEFPCAPPNMAYTDGGVFQNQPLGLAKELVNHIDQHRDDDSRFFLFVSPDGMKSNMSRDFRAKKAFLLPTGIQLIKCIFHQARYQDWVRAHEINSQVRTFDEHATKLKEVFVSGNINSAALAPVNGPLLAKMFDDAATLNKERARLRDQFRTELAELSALPDAQAANAWIDAILILETSAGLRHREHMEILTITASDDELCGELFFAFGGFFDEKFREYDYNCGRSKAREAIAEWNNGSIGPIRYTPNDAVPPLNKKLPATQMEDIAEAKREELRDRIVDRADDMLEAAGLGQPIRWAAKKFFVEPKIDAFFKL